MSFAYGANDFYEAFDFKNCVRWRFDNEPHGIELSKESKEYITAFELAKRQPNSRFNIQSWNELEQLPESERANLVSVYSASARGKSNKYIAKYGARYGSPSGGVTCLPNQDFPLTGASYRRVNSAGLFITLACVRGCDKAPTFIYDVGYENLEEHVEHAAAERKFRKRCGSAL